MKAVIARWKDEGYILVAKSDNEILLLINKKSKSIMDSVKISIFENK